ncbi:MAG TPA: HYExAFE family protein [Phycisphaerales bacterium]|nr:HYExAFE family protein [Phycisphaerales bacterium]
MAQRRFHYEQAFEHYLRANRVPYVAVDEAKKALLPTTAKKKEAQSVDAVAALKSFDFVVYAPHGNLLVDVKGRMFGEAKTDNPMSNRRYESWVTQDDVDSLTRWQELFGRDFTAVFVFAYCLRQQPPDALFDELFAFGERWYALREATLADYSREMRLRSSKWQTVHVPGEAFSRISRPFLARSASPQKQRQGALFGSA